MWTSSTGQAITLKPVTITLELPCEQCTAVDGIPANLAIVGKINWMAVLMAGISLAMALFTGNSTAIAAAIQSLINAFLGK